MKFGGEKGWQRRDCLHGCPQELASVCLDLVHRQRLEFRPIKPQRCPTSVQIGERFTHRAYALREDGDIVEVSPDAPLGAKVGGKSREGVVNAGREK